MANARAPGWYWITQDVFESTIIPKGPWVAYWTDSGAGYWTLACLGATWPDDGETIRVLAGPLPPPNEAPARDPLSREAWRQPIVDWLRALANDVNDGKWSKRIDDKRVDVAKDLRRAAEYLVAGSLARAWLCLLADNVGGRSTDPPLDPDPRTQPHEVAVTLRIAATAIEKGAPGASGPTFAELTTVLREAGFRVAKNIAHPFLGPTPEDQWMMWCCECGRDSGFHHDACSKHVR